MSAAFSGFITGLEGQEQHSIVLRGVRLAVETVSAVPERG